MALLAGVVLARTVAVGCEGDPGSLGEALGSARPGDRIELCGAQLGSFLIPAGVAVLGREGAVLDGGGAGTVVTLEGGARLENVTVRGDGGRLDRDDAAVLLEGEGAAVRDVRVEARAFGIYLKQATRASVVHSVVEGVPGLNASERGNGIHLWNTRGSRVEGCRVSGTRDGLYLSFAHHNLIASNEVSGVRFGIHYMYSDDNRVVRNQLHHSVAGAAMMFSKRNAFEGNTSTDNQRYGLLLKDIDSSAVRRNVFARDGKGMFVQQSAENDFSDNRIADNVLGVHLSAAAYGNTFESNALVHNVQQVLVHGARENRWDGNYWSDYTGTDPDGDGVGEPAYRAGDLAGYLADEYPMVRILEGGPAYDAIRASERLFPVLDFPGAVDHRPLMRLPAEVP